MKDVCGIYAVVVMFTAIYMLYYVFEKKMYLFCSLVTLSGVNSHRDIEFCSDCGMSAGDAFFTESLVLNSTNFAPLQTIVLQPGFMDFQKTINLRYHSDL